MSGEISIEIRCLEKPKKGIRSYEVCSPDEALDILKDLLDDVNISSEDSCTFEVIAFKDWMKLSKDVIFKAVKHFDEYKNFDYWEIKNSKGKIIEKYS